MILEASQRIAVYFDLSLGWNKRDIILEHINPLHLLDLLEIPHVHPPRIANGKDISLDLQQLNYAHSYYKLSQIINQITYFCTDAYFHQTAHCIC